jgi:hypothetical protein
MEDGRRLRNFAADKHGAAVAQRITPVIMDVTKKDDIITCQQHISRQCEENGYRFMGLVNNAGYGETAPLEVIPIESLRENYEGKLLLLHTSRCAKLMFFYYCSEFVWASSCHSSVPASYSQP